MKNVENLKQTFDKFKDLEIDSYLKSIPYFLLTGRKGFYFFRNEETSLSVAVHPNKENTLIVFPEFEGNGDLTVEVLNEFATKGFDIQLARYTQRDYEVLQFALRRDKKKVIGSLKVKEEDVLDWKYPAHILDTVKVAALKGKLFDKVRNKFNKVANSDEFEIVALSDPEAHKIVQSSIFHWLAGLAMIGRETDHNVSEFYQTLLKHMRDFPEFFDGFAIKKGKQAAGFTIWDSTGDTANAIAGLNDRSINGMSEFQMVTACRVLSESGIKKYNLGGSETNNLDAFKLKFHPVESIKMFSCDVAFEDEEVSPFQMLDVFGDNRLQM